MKLQSLGIIFIVIIFPMILVLSYYLSLQIETIRLQNDYNSKLIDATNDALTAFEINTANEDLSNVSDSLRSIVDASTNTFMNTLATSLGMSNASKDMIEAYVPAILYTMYDGYYIHAPTQKPEIKEKTYTNANGIVISEGAAIVGDNFLQADGTYRQGDDATYYNNQGLESNNVPGNANDYGSLLYAQDTNGNGIVEDGEHTTNINDANVTNTDYVLKSYMPYSATYVNGADSVTINYTLDNFMSISGIVGGIYYTKSGYYISNNVTSITVGSNSYSLNDYGQDEWKKICLDNSNRIEITVDGITIIAEASAGDEQSKANRKAIEYYLVNCTFSGWVNSNLGFVCGDNLRSIINFEELLNDADAREEFGYSIENINQMFYNFDGDMTPVFSGGDPEDKSSNFNTHKYNVIKNSIQYNLNLAISSYSEMFSGLTFEMPMLTDLEWEQITEKVSVVSFLQGLSCGLKTYSNYAVITSTNNELTVIPEEIYYVKASEFDLEDGYYHRIDCEQIRGESQFISFKSKEVKYDEIYKGEAAVPQYEYDHKNLACYDCIVQNNYHNYKDANWDKKINIRAFLGLENHIDEDGSFRDMGTAGPAPNALLKAYYIAIGKERQNLYKTTAYSKNEGVEVITVEPGHSISDVNWSSNSITKVEITLVVTKADGIVEDLIVGGNNVRISTATKSTQTVVIERNGATRKRIN